MRLKQVVGILLYNTIAKHLPTSYSRFNIGQRQLRAICGKLIMKKCGKKVNIEKGAVFSSKMTVGDYSGIGRRASLQGTITLGEYVMMGPDCIIYTRNHCFDDLNVPMKEQGFQEEKPVVIGDDVWIGGRVIILPGVKIGSHSIIGAGAVVAKDVPDYAIVGGNPAKVLKYRNEQRK